MVPIPRTIQALLFIALFAANAWPADEKDRSPLKDAFGDALPDGAIARMGSTRFRHAGLSEFVCLPDGKSIMTIGSDRVVRTWDPETGKRTRMVALEKGAGRLFTLSADGRIAAGCTQEALTIWETESGKVLATLVGPKSYPSQLCFSPDSTMIGVGGDNFRFTVWDWKAGKAIPINVPAPARQGGDSTFHCHFSPDSKYFAADASWQTPLCVFETKTGAEVQRFSCDAKTSVFSSDSKRLIVCSSKGGGNASIRVFDVATGKESSNFPLGDLGYYSLAVSPDDRVLGCGASDQSCLLDLKTGKVLHKLTGRPWGLAFTPDGKAFVASDDGTHLRFWDVATGKERHGQQGNFSSYVMTAVSPDGRFIAAADSSDRAIQLWNPATGKHVGQLPLKGEGRYTRNLTFSADGRTLTAGLLQGTVQTWEVATEKELRFIQLGERRQANAPSTYFHAIRMSADGRRLATVERVFVQPEDTRLTVWDAETGKPLHDRTFPGQRRRCAWSADGETVAIGLDAGVVLIDLDTGDERARLDGSAAGSLTVAMSPDGRLVAANRIGADKGRDEIGVYEVATGKAVATIAARADFCIGADNRTLFTADATHIRMWDLSTGKKIAERPIPDAGTTGNATVTQLVPLAGRRVFTPLADGTGLVWDFAPAAPVDRFANSTEKQLATWWADLLSDDSARAYAAIWRMADASPDTVIAFLRPHLQPEAPPDAAKLRQLIADMNSDTFRVREKATKDLQDLSHRAVPALRKALDAKPPAESLRRIEQLLSRKPDVGNRPEQLRRMRAMQVLERVGSKEVRELFAQLADGLPLAAETKEAKAALGRLWEQR